MIVIEHRGLQTALSRVIKADPSIAIKYQQEGYIPTNVNLKKGWVNDEVKKMNNDIIHALDDPTVSLADFRKLQADMSEKLKNNPSILNNYHSNTSTTHHNVSHSNKSNNISVETRNEYTSSYCGSRNVMNLDFDGSSCILNTGHPERRY